MENTVTENKQELEPGTILNLTTVRGTFPHWAAGLIELSDVDFKVICSMARTSCSSFSYPHLRIIDELLAYYEPQAVLIDDTLDRPGMKEHLTEKGIIILTMNSFEELLEDVAA